MEKPNWNEIFKEHLNNVRRNNKTSRAKSESLMDYLMDYHHATDRSFRYTKEELEEIIKNIQKTFDEPITQEEIESMEIQIVYFTDKNK